MGGCDEEGTAPAALSAIAAVSAVTAMAATAAAAGRFAAYAHTKQRNVTPINALGAVSAVSSVLAWIARRALQTLHVDGGHSGNVQRIDADAWRRGRRDGLGTACLAIGAVSAVRAIVLAIGMVALVIAVTRLGGGLGQRRWIPDGRVVVSDLRAGAAGQRFDDDGQLAHGRVDDEIRVGQVEA